MSVRKPPLIVCHKEGAILYKSAWRARKRRVKIGDKAVPHAPIRLCAAALFGLASAPLAAAAANGDAKIVVSLPPQVADVVTGGSWRRGSKGVSNEPS